VASSLCCRLSFLVYISSSPCRVGAASHGRPSSPKGPFPGYPPGLLPPSGIPATLRDPCHPSRSRTLRARQSATPNNLHDGTRSRKNVHIRIESLPRVCARDADPCRSEHILRQAAAHGGERFRNRNHTAERQGLTMIASMLLCTFPLRTSSLGDLATQALWGWRPLHGCRSSTPETGLPPTTGRRRIGITLHVPPSAPSCDRFEAQRVRKIDA